MRALLMLAVIAACAPARPPARPKPAATYEVHRYWINFVPFGAGQRQNGEPGKATLFAAGQLATGATSVGIWAYLVGHYGAHGTVTADEAGRVRTLQRVEVASAAVFWVLVAWGIADALYYYQPRVEVTPTSVTYRW